jgi:hypothetical protein
LRVVRSSRRILLRLMMQVSRITAPSLLQFWKRELEVPLLLKPTKIERRQRMSLKYLSYIPSEINMRLPLSKQKLIKKEVR